MNNVGKIPTSFSHIPTLHGFLAKNGHHKKYMRLEVTAHLGCTLSSSATAYLGRAIYEGRIDLQGISRSRAPHLQSHEGNNQLAPITTKPAAAIHKSLGELSQAGITQKYSATNVQTSPGNTEHVDDQETRATEVPHASPKGGSYSAGSSKKGKIGLAFLKPKTMVSSQMKSTQMKELKRMIRAGKPSFEQIHSWRNSFEMLLKDRFGLALFKDFLSTEFSDENIEFWIACQEYKQITQPKKLAAKAQRIFDEFIAVQANREVNLDSKTRLETEADLANPTVHTLDNAQKRIQALMEKDSYRRFLRSDVYLTLYSEAREVAKAAASSALAASLQDASDELDGAILHLVNATPSNSPFSFLSNLGTTFNSSVGTGLNLPGVAAAAAKAEAGMNSIQDLQLLGLSTSRHMRNARAQQTQSRVKTAPNHNPRVLSADPPRTEKQPPGVSESDM
ncbi:unnamed protein product [Calicophoron daubneyi]|uniref:RGS domain-containing protein n=1 Tax=Calicophoron daubneyi TaxID=300641 RepID=A0AAV2TMT8_CALDB